MLYTLLLITLLNSGAIYLLEPREIIPTLRDALWFTVITMSTVGYGDIAPTTLSGRALTGFLVVLSSLYMAIPIGIVGNAFSKVCVGCVWGGLLRAFATGGPRRGRARFANLASDFDELGCFRRGVF